MSAISFSHLSTSMLVDFSSSSSPRNILSHDIHPESHRYPIVCGLIGTTSAFDD